MQKRVFRVADILDSKRSGVLTIKPSETIEVLACRLQSAQVGAMIVSQDGQSVDGIISERDVAYGLAHHRGGLHTIPVAALMTKTVITCSRYDSLTDVARVMTELHIGHIPVTDGKQIVGVIGMRDIVMCLDRIKRPSRQPAANYSSARH